MMMNIIMNFNLELFSKKFQGIIFFGAFFAFDRTFGLWIGYL
jgi:hypothetical protein